MTLFLSSFINKIDKKGRVSVPSSFRSVINEQSSFYGIVTYNSFINNCIEACSMKRIEQLSQSIDLLDPYSDERDAFATSILGGSIQLAFDPEGRITLPEELMQLANLQEQACFVGKGMTFEIWNPELFAQYSEQAREIAKNNRASLRLHVPKIGEGAGL